MAQCSAGLRPPRRARPRPSPGTSAAINHRRHLQLPRSALKSQVGPLPHRIVPAWSATDVWQQNHDRCDRRQRARRRPVPAKTASYFEGRLRHPRAPSEAPRPTHPPFRLCWRRRQETDEPLGRACCRRSALPIQVDPPRLPDAGFPLPTQDRRPAPYPRIRRPRL